MEKDLTLRPAAQADMRAIKRLYCAAFPRSERKPFSLLQRQCRRGLSEILVIGENGRFLGFMIVVLYLDMAMLDYFAISPDARSGGVGGRAMACLRERFQKRRLFLEVERIVPEAPNLEQRVRRKDFYLRNGMQDSSVFICIYGNSMELMHADRPVAFSEYCSLLRATLGPLFYRWIRPRPEQ